MNSNLIRFQNPDPSSPGDVLAEILEARSIKKHEFATRCGRTPKLISEIISGKATIVPETAIQFARVLNIPAETWLNLEAKYRLYKEKISEGAKWEKYATWPEKFPISELIKRGHLAKTNDYKTTIEGILDFFGTGSIKSLEKLVWETAKEVHFRKSDKYTQDKLAEFTWLRIGKIKAKNIVCQSFDTKKFREALIDFRRLTHQSMEDFLPYLQSRCAESGVALIVETKLDKTHISGVARWLSKDKALIQLSNLGKFNDRFWFNFYHEAAHILLHSKKTIYWDLDTNNGDLSEKEEAVEKQADDFAANILIPQQKLYTYLSTYSKREQLKEQNLRNYAAYLDISPGILLGQIQKKTGNYATRLNTILKLKLSIPNEI